MARPDVVLVCDASPQVGSGHVFRLSGLADALRAAAAVHLVLPIDPDVRAMAGSLGADVRDRPRLPEIVSELRPMWLFFDEAGDRSLLDEVRRRSPVTRIAVSEYWLLRDQSVDLAVVPFEPFPERQPIMATETLAGLPYLGVRSQVSRWSRSRAVVPPHPGRLLIFFGSADPSGHTGAVLDVLASVAGRPPVVDVVLGRFLPSAISASIQQAAATIAGARIATSPPDFVQRLAAADVVMCAGGVTLSEAACLGVPAIVWPHHEAEARFAEAFVRGGAAVAIGSASELAGALQAVGPARRREAMIAAGQELVDGLGAQRVAAALLARRSA